MTEDRVEEIKEQKHCTEYQARRYLEAKEKSSNF